ncbi:MAG: phage portal protein [Paracoccaceae bacterium]
MSGFTAELMSARESYISGRRGIAELTATVQSCATLWENGLSSADVKGTTFLTRNVLGMIARSLAFRGEAVFLITQDGLVPVADWDLRTRNGVPTAYRVSVSEAGGGRNLTALAPEVLHVVLARDPAAPWAGQAPLKRAQLSAGMLNAVETALAEVFENAPLGSSIVPYPESTEEDMAKLARGFRGARGRMMLRESVNVPAAGGPAPQTDWKPQSVSPDLERSMSIETLKEATGSVGMLYGVLPALLSPATTGPLVREAQRHLAQWVLQPVCNLIAEEASDKLATPITLDCMRPLQAFDAGGRARAAAQVVQLLAQAKEAGVDPKEAMKLVDWDQT